MSESGAVAGVAKAPSGVTGLDEVTGGGLPAGRSTLVCGSAGCGKTLLALQFLVRGALDHGEPGVFFSFEETTTELAQNVASLGWDLDGMARDGLLTLHHLRLAPTEVPETGSFDLEGLFIQVGAAIDAVGARRVAFDTLEVLFAALADERTLRSELRRLIAWLKDRSVTAVITSERGAGQLTRFGLEEYVADCVILLDHRVDEQISTRRMRIVKYRGSAHISDEVPFVIDRQGFAALPLSSMQLAHEASDERVSSGVARLDAMLGGEGYYRGSSVLISGTPGSGKTTLAASFLAAGCARGERCLLLAFEESPDQLLRNLRSVGIDLAPFSTDGLLQISSSRPASRGLESHLASIMSRVDTFAPALVVVDPLSAFTSPSTEREDMLARLVDLLKVRGVTAVATSLVKGIDEMAGLGISSVIDTWLAVTTNEHNGERNRGLSVIKSRGMSHSNQIREFDLTARGVVLRDVYTGPAGVLMGTARQVQEAHEATEERLREERSRSMRTQLDRRRAAIVAEVEALRARLEADVEQLASRVREEELAGDERRTETVAMAHARGADAGDEGSR